MRVSSIFAILLSGSMLAIPQIAVADSVEVVQEPAIDRLFERGKAAYDAGNHAEVERIMRQVIRRDRNNSAAYNNLGNALSDKGKLEEAVEAYQQAIRLDPDNAIAYNNLGVALSDKGKLEEAVEAYQQSIRLDLDYAIAYYNLGVALSDKGKLEEAVEAYQQAIRLDPDHASPYISLGIVLSAQGKLEKALDKCHQVLKLPDQDTTSASTHTFAHNCLGLIYQKQEKYEEAIAEFRKAIQLNANWQIPRDNLRETERLLALKLNPQPVYIDDFAWLPENDRDVPLLRSVVRVIADTPDGSQTGTGWVIKREENRIWILTARHVIHHEDTRRMSDKIAVDFYSEPPRGKVHRRQDAKPVRIPSLAEDLDLVLLEVVDPPEDIQPLSVLSQQMNRGDTIRIIGHPVTGLPWTMVSGEISNRSPELLQIAQTTVAAGNSGGPVLDEQGRVIGILIEVSNSDNPQTAGFAFAYSLTYIEVWLKRWEIF